MAAYSIWPGLSQIKTRTFEDKLILEMIYKIYTTISSPGCFVCLRWYWYLVGTPILAQNYRATGRDDTSSGQRNVAGLMSLSVAV